MEHRKSIKGLIIVSFLLLITGFIWYLAVPKQYDDKVTIDKVIPSKEAITFVDKFNPSREYYFSQDVLLQKNKTWIPFVFKTDTIQKTQQKIYNRDR